MLTCTRLQCEAVDLLAVHPFRTPHARRQLEAEVAQQLCHAGIVHDSGQRLPNALPRPCGIQSWISLMKIHAVICMVLLVLHGRSCRSSTCVTSHGARLLCVCYCLSCNEHAIECWVYQHLLLENLCSHAGCATYPVNVKRDLLLVHSNQQAASI